MRAMFWIGVWVCLLAGCIVSPETSSQVEIQPELDKSNNSPTHHVSGGGVSIAAVGDTSQFEFNAKEQKGVVKGHAEFVSSTGQALRASIDCLTVVGNEAWLSGVVTESNGGLAGLPIVFRIVDNGEGHKTIDQIARPFIGTTETCLTQPAMVLQPVLEGNIQVR